MKNTFFLILFLMGCFQIVFSQQNESPVFVGTVEGVKEYKLPNGLQILLVRDPSISNFIVNIVYRVGSRYEGYGETGMAHLLEHMLFKPSKKFPDIKKEIGSKGAESNASTWLDRTNYYEILPASDSNISWALDMESDRMVNSLIRSEDLQKEFSVVRNEFEDRENYSNNILEERVISTMYLWHNYGKSTIGSKEDIERVSAESLKNFYEKYYRPDNATLIIGGNFDEAKTLVAVGKYFGPIPRPEKKLQQPYTVEPIQDGQRFVELRRNGDIQYLMLGYHTPAFSDPTRAANAAAIKILTNDPSGIFYRALVDMKLVTSVTGNSEILYDPGYTTFSCTVPLNKSLDSAKQVFISTADSLQYVTISQEDLERAKNAILKDLDNSQNNTMTFVSDETEYIGAGDWRLFYIYRDRVKNLKIQDVQGVLKKYYLPSNRTVGVFIPDKMAEKNRVAVAATPDINAMVKVYKGDSGYVETGSFPATIENIKNNTLYGSLSNGMQYALLKKPSKGNKVYVKMILKMGDENSLNGKTMQAAITARMLKKGTETRSKKEINDLLDQIKTTLDFISRGGRVIVSMNTDRGNLNAAFNLLYDLLQHPKFNSDEFEKTKLEIKSDLEANQSEPSEIAYIAVDRKITHYPKGHPFYAATTEEMLQSLQGVSLDDVNYFYKKFYGANHGFISVVGNFDTTDVKNTLEKGLGNFVSKEPQNDLEVRYFDVKGSEESINVNDKTNAFCWGVIDMPVKQSDPDFVALDIANELLGGGGLSFSRISKRLREEDGLSYGAGSAISARYKYASSDWFSYAIFNPKYKNRLDSALRDVITNTSKNGFQEDEFRKGLSAWVVGQQAQLSQDNDLANKLVYFMYDGKTLNFQSEYMERAKKLTLNEVNAAFRKYISMDKITLVYVGSFNKDN